MKPINYQKLESLVIQPGMEKQLVPLALYKGGVSLGDVHRRWNFTVAAMLAESESVYDARDLWKDEKLAKLCFWNVTQPPSLMHIGSWISRMYDNPKTVENIPGLWEFVEHWYRTAGKYKFSLHRIPLESARWECVTVPWRRYVAKPRKPRKQRELSANPYEICYPFLIHKPDKAGANQGYDLLMKINKAVGSLSREIKADVCQDLAVAILSGDMQESELEGEVKQYVRKVMQMYPTKYGPVSLDAALPGRDGMTLLDTLVGNGYAM